MRCYCFHLFTEQRILCAEYCRKAGNRCFFPGGPEAFKRYVEWGWDKKNPVTNGAPKGTYEIVVHFYVGKTGSISDVVALTKFGYGMEDLAIKLIQNGPNWIPAQTRSRYVNSYCDKTISFIVK